MCGVGIFSEGRPGLTLPALQLPAVWPCRGDCEQSQRLATLAKLCLSQPGASRQKLGLMNQQAALADAQHPLRRVLAQHPIDRLPGRANHLREFLMGQAQLECQALLGGLRALAGQAQQHARQALVGGAGNAFNQRIRGQSQAPADQANDVERQFRVLAAGGCT